jgi:BMFP domain-containing protein YqiC
MDHGRQSIPRIGTQAGLEAIFTIRPSSCGGWAQLPLFLSARRPSMTQTSNRFFDEIARLMNDAAGVAQGVRREFDTLFRTQAERWLQDLDLVKREELEAVKDMARIAREENEALKARVAALEAKLGQGGASPQNPPGA